MDSSELEKIFDRGKLDECIDAVYHFRKSSRKFSETHLIFERLQHLKFDNQKYKIALLASYTIDQLLQPAVVELFGYGINSEIYIGGYNQYVSELYNRNSSLYENSPNMIILSIRFEDVSPVKSSEDIIRYYKSLILKVKEHSDAKIVIHNFAYPTINIGSTVTPQKNNIKELIDKLNQSLVLMAGEFDDCYIFDLQQSIYNFGANHAYDNRLYYLSRNPFSKEFLLQLAYEQSRQIKSLLSVRKKCLVLDADNTLWGGIIGEQGISGIQIGDTYPGNIFSEIQKIIKQYAENGIILALNSKNNFEDVKEVFEKHPDMVLKWDDFACKKINWNDKAKNIAEIATELNIGLDSIVFVDDSQFETGLVNDICPQVEIIQFTEDHLNNLRVINNIESFDSLKLTKDDLNKTKQYLDNVKREKLRTKMNTIDDYYHSLEMKIVIQECTEIDISRVAQLTQKTNQFNFTTIRYSETDIKNFVESSSHRVYTLRLSDKIGESGLTGVSIIDIDENKWIINSFLLSCRIIGRTIEDAFLAELINDAKDYGISEIVGKYVETSKNKLVKDFYKKNNFLEDGVYWKLLIERRKDRYPWIEVIR